MLLLLLFDDCCWFCDLRLKSDREEMRDSRPLDRGLSGELLEEAREERSANGFVGMLSGEGISFSAASSPSEESLLAPRAAAAASFWASCSITAA